MVARGEGGNAIGDLGQGTQHILRSVSKTLLALHAGQLAARGQLDVDSPVTRYVPEARGTGFDGASVRQLLDMRVGLDFAEDYLAQHPWFGGAQFSTADIMMVFPLNFAMQLNIVDKNQFPRINAWKAKIEARPAYQRMIAKARPKGMIGNLAPLPKHAPPGPRPGAAAAQPKR